MDQSPSLQGKLPSVAMAVTTPLIPKIVGFISRSGWPAKLAYALGFQKSVEVTTHQFFVCEPTQARHRLRVVFAADFHFGPMTHGSFLKGVCERIAATNPDVLLLGGDFVSNRADNMRELARWLSAIKTPFGKFAVIGNHDLWCGQDEIIKELEQIGATVLLNRNFQLPDPFNRVWVCGIDDGYFGNPSPEAAFDGADGIRVVMMHSPFGLHQLLEHNLLFAICGHTHGGQIALPNGYPLYLPDGSLSRKFSSGRFDLDRGGTLIVSRGVGFSTVPFRLFSPPEIVVCDVHI